MEGDRRTTQGRCQTERTGHRRQKTTTLVSSIHETHHRGAFIFTRALERERERGIRRKRLDTIVDDETFDGR